MTAVLEAARYCDRVIARDQGRVVADEPPLTVVTPEFLTSQFGVHATVTTDPVTGRIVCLPYAAATD